MIPLRACLVGLLGAVFLSGAILLDGRCTMQAAEPKERAAAEPTDEQLITAEIERIVRNIRVSVGGAEARRPLELLKGPLLKFEVPSRCLHGTLWAWSGEGRPQVVLSLALFGSPDEPLWLQEIVSLSSKPASATTRGSTWWSTETPGWNPKVIPNAPKPAERPEERLRQMKQLAARFAAQEYENPENPWDVPRLAEPVLRYGNPTGKPLDGAIFVFALHVRNPEILLSIEAENNPQDGIPWKYNAAPVSANGLVLKLDGKEVWRREPSLWGFSPRDPYYLRNVPVRAEIERTEAEEPKP